MWWGSTQIWPDLNMTYMYLRIWCPNCKKAPLLRDTPMCLGAFRLASFMQINSSYLATIVSLWRSVHPRYRHRWIAEEKKFSIYQREPLSHAWCYTLLPHWWCIDRVINSYGGVSTVELLTKSAVLWIWRYHSYGAMCMICRILEETCSSTIQWYSSKSEICHFWYRHENLEGSVYQPDVHP